MLRFPKAILLVVAMVLCFATSGWGATYYFHAADGTDHSCTVPASSNCSDYETPCKTIDCLNDMIPNLSAGDEALLAWDEEWNKSNSAEWSDSQIIIEKSGINSTNRIIIGAYDDSDGSQVSNTLDWSTSGHNRPHLDYDAQTPPGGGIIHSNPTNGIKYVTIENLWISDVADGADQYAGYGMYLRRQSGGTQPEDIRILNCLIHDVPAQGIGIFWSKNCQIKYNIVHDTNEWNDGYCWDVGNAAIEFNNLYTQGMVVAYNRVYDNYSEGIGSYFSWNYADNNPNVIEYNVLYSNRSYDIHVTDGDAIIRFNLVGEYDANSDGFHKTWAGYNGWCTASGVPHTCCTGSGTGSCQTVGACARMAYGGIDVETTSGGAGAGAATTRIKVYGNIVFGTGEGIGIEDPTESDAGDVLYGEVYNNTVVDSGQARNNSANNATAHYRMNLDNNASSTISFKNNISYFEDSIDANKLHANFSGSRKANITRSNNLWCLDSATCGDSSDVDEDARGDDDVYADPKLVGPSGYSYIHPTTISQFTGQEFNILQGSAAIEDGITALCASSDSCATGDCDCGFDQKTPAGTDFTAIPIIIDLQDRDADPATWSIGAWEWQEPPTPVADECEMGGAGAAVGGVGAGFGG